VTWRPATDAKVPPYNLALLFDPQCARIHRGQVWHAHHWIPAGLLGESVEQENIYEMKNNENEKQISS
jgi:hypothetical protein